MPTCGSLFSGAGLLDCGLTLAGWEHAWLCEADEFRRGLLRKRFPEATVFDDVRTVRGQAAADADRGGREGEGRRRALEGDERAVVADAAGLAPCGCPWEYIDAGGFCARCHAHIDDPAGLYAQQPRREAAPDAYTERGNGLARLARGGVCGPGWWADSSGFASRVDLIALGFPCRGVSSAGKRQGFDNAETVLWHEGRRVIGELAPRYVIVENVAAILSMAASPGEPAGSLWGIVLSDLAALGFDVRWDVIPAAAVGAPHLRERVFAVGVRRGAGVDAERTTGTGRRGGPAAGNPNALAGAPSAALDRGPGAVDEPGAVQRAERPDRVLGNAPDADAAHGQGHRSAERVSAQEPGDHGQHSVAVDWGDYGPAIRRWEAIHGPAPEPLVRRLDDGNPKLRRVRARVDRSRLSALGDGVQVQCGRLVGEYVMSLIDGEQRAAA